MIGRAVLFIGLAVGLASSSHAQGVGSCEHGMAHRFIETPVLRAAVMNTGSLFFGGSTTSGDGYIIPRWEEAPWGGPVSTIFAAGLWLGGKVDGQLRVAAARYGQWDFWPGPLEDAANPPADCSEHDRIYVVSRQDIARYLATGERTPDLRDWPVHLGAPVLDGDGDSTNYDLRAGDQPELIGDVAAWWVMNDAGNDHGNSGRSWYEGESVPLGVEVRVLAFAFGNPHTAQSRALTQTTFYRYEVINRGHQPVDSMYAAMWADFDLGDAGDDYVGTDTLRHMVYAYNDSNFDYAYGEAPPAQGIQVLQGPIVERDTLRATSAGPFFACYGPITCTDPSSGSEFYNYMLGLWPNGTPYYEYGSGFEQAESGASTTRFMLAGDPVTESFYSELNVDGRGTDSPQGDRRVVISTGPFRLEPGASATLLYAMPYARSTSHLQSVAALRAIASVLQTASSRGAFDQSSPVTAGEHTGGLELAPALALSRVQPNPSSGTGVATLTLPTEARVRATVYDALGRQLEVLVDGELPEGTNALAMPDGLAPGTYLLRVEVAPGAVETLTFTVAR